METAGNPRPVTVNGSPDSALRRAPQVEGLTVRQRDGGSNRAESTVPDVGERARRLAALPERLRQVAEGLARGLTSKEIAQGQDRAVVSVDRDRANLCRALDLPWSLGNNIRRQLVVETHHRFLADTRQPVPSTTAPAGPTEFPVPQRESVTAGTSPSACFGAGVPVVLSSPETILGVEVISGSRGDTTLEVAISQSRRRGFLPEMVVVYPTTAAESAASFLQLVLIKRR